MRREAALPPVWAYLQGSLHYVQHVSPTEYSAACPECGGTVHPDGTWPDRLRIFCDAKPLMWCRRCGMMRFPDQAGARPADREAIEKWRHEMLAREEGRRRSAEQALHNLRKTEVWRRYHEGLDSWARAYWRGRGIPDEWQDRWALGWAPHYPLRGPDGRLRDTTAATIPLFDTTGSVLNVKLRLIDPPPSAGRYRYLIPAQPHPMFLANPQAGLNGHVIAIEGEIKAAVTYIALAQDDMAVVGLPGSNPGQHVIDTLAAASQVTLVMDPDAAEQATQLAAQTGLSKTRVLVLPEKIDDIIIASKPSPAMVRRWLAQAQAPKPQRRTA